MRYSFIFNIDSVQAITIFDMAQWGIWYFFLPHKRGLSLPVIWIWSYTGSSRDGLLGRNMIRSFAVLVGFFTARNPLHTHFWISWNEGFLSRKRGCIEKHWSGNIFSTCKNIFLYSKGRKCWCIFLSADFLPLFIKIRFLCWKGWLKSCVCKVAPRNR